jgi:hypothetical protein
MLTNSVNIFFVYTGADYVDLNNNNSKSDIV